SLRPVSSPPSQPWPPPSSWSTSPTATPPPTPDGSGPSSGRRAGHGPRASRPPSSAAASWAPCTTCGERSSGDAARHTQLWKGFSMNRTKYPAMRSALALLTGLALVIGACSSVDSSDDGGVAIDEGVDGNLDEN